MRCDMQYRLSGSVWRTASFWIVGGTEKWKDGPLRAGRIFTELDVVVWNWNSYQFHRTRRCSSVDHFIGHHLSCTEFRAQLDQSICYYSPEISTGELDPWVGPGRINKFCKLKRSGRVGHAKRISYLIRFGHGSRV